MSNSLLALGCVLLCACAAGQQEQIPDDPESKTAAAAPAGQAAPAEPGTAAGGDKQSAAAAAPSSTQSPAEADAGSGGLVDLQRARRLLRQNRYDDLIDIIRPADVERLPMPERQQLAELYWQAAQRLRQRHKDVSYSSLFCERGLLLVPEHQPLLRLQVSNYLHPDLKLLGGAEELAEKLVHLDPDDQHNQLLRGKAAFEQGEWELAIKWLERAARAGRQHTSKEVQEAWHLLDLARGRAQEVKSALSMTRELERRLKLTRARIRELSHREQAAQQQEAAQQRLAGGDVALYMTSWCGYCRKARALLKELGVSFQEFDIEKNPRAMEDLLRRAELAGVKVNGVPVVRIGNSLVVGYNPERIKQLVQQLK